MKSHGLRGSELENIINSTIEFYRTKKIALIQKIPTPITPLSINKEKGIISKAYFEKKSTVDYIGVVQEIAVCFDAKETKTDKFPLKNIHKHQFEFMKDFEYQGGVAFLLIYFKSENTVYYMRFKELEKFITRKKESFDYEELDENYFINKFNLNNLPFLEKLQLDIDER